MHEVNEAAFARFGPMGMSVPAKPESLEELATRANHEADMLLAALKVDGDHASLTTPEGIRFELKFIGGQWKVDGRILRIEPVPEKRKRDLIAMRIGTEVLSQVKQEITEGKFFDWPTADKTAKRRLGEALANSPEYMEVLGFRYVFGSWIDHQVFRTLEPLFELPAAGKAAADAPGTNTFVARAGYVVGGLIVAADDVSPVAVRVIFVRWKDGGVDATDTYTSAWIGTPGKAHQQQLAGTGEKVIGTFGRQGLNVNAIGLLIAPPAAGPASRPGATRPMR